MGSVILALKMPRFNLGVQVILFEIDAQFPHQDQDSYMQGYVDQPNVIR